MNAFYYLLEANIYLLVFYAFYRIFLKDETFYTLNRFYLLGTGVISFILPAFKLSGLYAPQVQYAVYTSSEVIQQPESFWTAFHTGLIIYLLISAFFLVRFALRVYRISLLIREGKLRRQDNFNLVEIKGSDLSFSFMNYLFINPELQKIDTIIRHEEVHIRERHSFDILFFEILHIACWFNPLITLMQNDIKAVHEYIADEGTAVAERSAADYALFLIHSSYGAAHQSLGSQMFSKSLLKKRLMMLNQKRSSKGARLKYAFLFVLMPLMLCASAMAFTKTYGLVDLMPANAMVQKDTTKRLPPPPPQPPKAKSQSSKASSKGVPPPPPPTPAKPKIEKLKIADPGKIKQDVTKDPPPPPAPPKSSARKVVSFSAVEGDVVKAPPPPPVAPASGSKLPEVTITPKNSGQQAPPPPPVAPAGKAPAN